MDALRPRIHGWGLAAGIVLWLTAAFALYLAIGMWPNDPAGELPLGLFAVSALTIAIGVGFWRGNSVARWLAVLPALALFLGALGFFGLGSICAAGAPPAGQPAPDALSCPNPRPEPTIGSLVLRFGIPLGLAASGVVVLVGIRRPGVRGPGQTGTP